MANNNTFQPTTASGKKRSRRLRKKLRIGEFQELGFEVEVKLKNSLTSEAEFALVEAFLVEIIEPRLLIFGGGVKAGFIAFCKRGSASEKDREAIRNWLLSRPEVETVFIGPLVDAWHVSEAADGYNKALNNKRSHS